MSKAVFQVVAVFALAFAGPAFGAAKTKPASPAKATANGSAQWADMPRGKAHQLRGKVDIRGAKAEFWKTHAPVILRQTSETDATCDWGGHKPPSLQGAQLFVENDHTGQWLYLMLGDGSHSFIKRPWSYGAPNANGESSFIVSDENGSDWTYFVLFEDSAATTPGRIVKTYRVEIFPPKSVAKDTCNAGRPDQAIKLVSRDGLSSRRLCESGVGDGNEPKH